MAKQLIVAGFHRSKTSVAAHYLQRCGLFVGSDLLGANASNPYGHFEDREVVRIHTDVLAANRQTWIISESFIPSLGAGHWQVMRDFIAKRNSKHLLWGFKDPRVCNLLAVWKYVLPDAKVLIIFRNPRECVASLHRRHAHNLFAREGNPRVHMRFFREPDLALRMWNVHNAALVAFAEAHPRDVLVLNQHNFAEEFPLATRLNELWNLGLECIPLAEVYDETVSRTATVQTRVCREDVVRRTLDIWRRLALMEAKTTGIHDLPTNSALKASDFRRDRDITMIRMENELLRFENSFLKSNSRNLASIHGDVDEPLADLRYILRKISKLPFGLYFRRKKKLKAIFERYGNGL